MALHSKSFAEPIWALDDQTLKNVRELNEKDIRLFPVISSLSNKAEKDLRGKSSNAKIADRLLRKIEQDVRKKAGKYPAPEVLLNVVNETMFGLYHFQVDRSRLFEDSLDTTLLNSAIQNRKGNCLTLSLVYLFIADRLNLPLRGVVVPGHFFLQYVQGPQKINIESTDSGRALPDGYYRQRFYNRPDSLEFKALTKKETIAVYLNNLANHYKLQGHHDRAITILKTAIQMLPDQASFFVNLGNAYERSGEIIKAAGEYDKALVLDPYLCEAYYNLGLIHFLYTRRYDLAERYGGVARKLGCRLHPKFSAFLNQLDAAGGKLFRPPDSFNP